MCGGGGGGGGGVEWWSQDEIVLCHVNFLIF